MKQKFTFKFWSLGTKLLAFFLTFIFNSWAVETVVPFTTPGATTWTCPAGVTSITVECWGGGGAGGGAYHSNTTYRALGGGGSGGGYAKKVITVVPETIYNLTVGSGGVGIYPTSADNNVAAASGGASYFNSTDVKANGGVGGKSIYTSNGSNVNGAGGTFVATNQVGDIVFNGGNGGTGNGTNSGSGGGSAGTESNGINGVGNTSSIPTAAVIGGGTGGAGYNAINKVGFAGGTPGGGGGGAKASNTTNKGGNGGNGQIIITYTNPEPTITSTPTTLGGFAYQIGSGPSTSQSVSISGTNLTGFPADLTVTAPANYEVSLDDATFASSVLVPFTSATLPTTVIHVRLKAGLSGGNYTSENISITGGGLATAYTIACSGGVSGSYTWNGSISTDEQVAGNWTPSRPAAVEGDILQINSGGSVTITNVATQTLDQLLISNNTTVELQASANAIISISGGTGTDLVVPSGSSLTLGGSDYTIKINLATGTTGTIGGNVTFTGSNSAMGLNHQITTADVDAIHFTSGAVMTAGTNFTGYPFGTTPNGAVIFESGSSYIHGSGNTPTGGGNNVNVVTFSPGSLYKFTGLVGGTPPAATTQKPAIATKTYANYEISTVTTIGNSNPAGDVVFENMVLNGSTFSISGNTNGAKSYISGNVTIGTGGGVTFGTGLGISPVVFNGTTPQTITLTDNGLFTIGSKSIMYVNNDLTLDGNMTLSGTINVAAGKTLTIAAGKTLTLPSGAILNVASGAKLDNLGTITNSGTLTLQSDATGTASLISSGTITGNVTVERYMTKGGSNGSNWHLVAPPVSGQDIHFSKYKPFDQWFGWLRFVRLQCGRWHNNAGQME